MSLLTMPDGTPPVTGPVDNASAGPGTVPPSVAFIKRLIFPPLGLLPFVLFILLFLGGPVVGIVMSALRIADPSSPGEQLWSLENFRASFEGAAGAAMHSSILVSVTSAVIGGSLGLVLAQAILNTRSARLSSVVAVLTSVLANSGGVPLAFSFIAALGNAGILTVMFSLTEHGFTLYSSGGLVLMYQYFLIPTMVMVVLPTLAGMRKQWKEAASSLGGTTWDFWRRIGLPIATPAILSGFVLLFGAAFATHASAAALVGSGGVPLVTLRIAGGLSGGNLAGQENVAMALGVNMILIAAVVLLVYMPLQRRSLKWFK